MFIAESLGKFHYEVVDMPAYEFDMWLYYFKKKQEDEKKALGKSKNNKGSSTPPRKLPKKER